MSGKRRVRDWQKTDPHLRAHPLFLKFRARLGVSVNEAHGILSGVWAFAFKFAHDGDLSRFKPEDIALSVEWTGPPEALMDALSVGFVVDGHIHDWHDWGGALFDERAKEARRKWESRNLPEQEDVSEDVQKSPGTMRDDGPEEKRREKIKRDVSSADDTFARFWDSYPPQKRKEKAKARRCWDARLNAGEEAELMILATQHYADTVVGFDPRYVKLAATFIGPDRPYEDYVTKNGGNGNGSEPAVAGPGQKIRHLSDLDEEGMDIIRDVLWDTVEDCEIRELSRSRG